MRLHPRAPKARLPLRAPRAAFLLLCAGLFAPAVDAAAAQGQLAQSAAPLVHPMPAGTVAVFEVELPDTATFVLRGTLPVPLPAHGGPGNKSFAVVEPGGARVLAQTEIVSRYARPEDGADVLELLARVKRPLDAPPGARRSYPIVLLPAAAAPIASPPFPLAGLVVGPADVPLVVWGLLTNPGSLRVQARDVFGHLYRLDLFGPEAKVTLLKHGHVHSQVRIAGTLLPVAPVDGPQGTLPHHVGVHAYLGTYAGEPVVTLDLRVHNGHDGRLPNDPTDDPLGNLYFERIELDLPLGYHAVESVNAPGTGAFDVAGTRLIWQLVEPLADGKMQLLPRQSQFHRRLALAAYADLPRAQALLLQQGVGFARRGTGPSGHRLWSWWNPLTARWFPQNFPLPSLEYAGIQTLRTKLTTEYDTTRAHFEQGTSAGAFPILEPRMGWAHPWGIGYGGMSGGTEIYLFDGLREVEAASREGLLHAQLIHTMNTDRQSTALYGPEGQPASLGDWLTAASPPYLPFGFYMKLQGPHDPFGFGNAPTFQTEAVQAAGKQPPYEEALLAYQPHDLQHLIRYTRVAKVLAWATNDSLAKDDLLMQAELVRLSYHEFHNSSSGYIDSTGLRADMEFAGTWPGRGVDFGRGEGWGVDTVVSAYALGTPVWRAATYGWFMNVALTVAVAITPCSGHLQARVQNKMLEGKYRAAQSFEDSIVHNTLRGVTESVFRGRHPAYTALLDDVMTLQYWAFIGPLQWNHTLNGPKDIYAIGPVEVSEGIWCEGWMQPADGFVPTVNTFQTPSTLAYAYVHTGQIVFLERAAQMLGPDPITKLFHPMLNNIENRAALVALAQLLAGQM